MRQGALIAGKYRIQHLLGDGAAGEVWSARNERTDRDVAIKLITGADRELRERAVREARALGRVSHRNVIEVLDAGETERGDPFLVMPRLEGETLGDRLRREGRLPPQKAAAIALEVARGLSAAHAVGIIHRDLKPNNIFLHRDAETGLDQVKVLDFGVSKMMRGEGPPTTRTGDIVGSPAYMSPEQAKADQALDHRTDLWSLGVVLFEMLAGRRPFTSKSITVIADIVAGPIPSIGELAPAIEPRLARVVARCLTRDVSQRVQSAQELAGLLRPCAGAEDVWGGSESSRRPPSSSSGGASVPAPAIQAAPTDEDQIPTVHVGAGVMAALAQPPQPPSSGAFRPVPTTLLDSSRSSEEWRQAAAAAREHAARVESGSAVHALPPAPPPYRPLIPTADLEEEASTAHMRRAPEHSAPPAPAPFQHPSMLSAPLGYRHVSAAPAPQPPAPQPPAPSPHPLSAPPPVHPQPAPPTPSARSGLSTGAVVLIGAGSLLTLAVLVALVLGLNHHFGPGREGGAATPPPAVERAK